MALRSVLEKHSGPLLPIRALPEDATLLQWSTYVFRTATI